MPMNYEEAKRQLVLHAGAIDEAQKVMILEDGFLPSLRPYRGLQEKNIHLVMEALLTVGERIHSAPQVDRELITTIWWMCTTARLWGLRPDGMLQACKLLTAEDILRLELWVNAIEETALSLLGGSPPHKAVYHYAKYVVEIGWWDNIGFFIPLMQRAVSDRDIGSAITMILRALSKLGSLAKEVLPTLYEALGREHSWNKPEFETPTNLNRTTDAVRASIQEAIDAIEGSDGKEVAPGNNVSVR